MHKIDWSRFTGNLRPGGYHVGARDKPWDEFIAPYVDHFEVSAEEKKKWGVIVFSPTDEERDALLKLVDVVIERQDQISFFQAVEADICEALVNMAGRIERGEPLNVSDCSALALDLEDIETMVDSLDEPELHARAKEAVAAVRAIPGLPERLDRYKEEADTLYSVLG